MSQRSTLALVTCLLLAACGQQIPTKDIARQGSLEALEEQVNELVAEVGTLRGRIRAAEALEARVETIEALTGRVEALEDLPNRLDVLEAGAAGIPALVARIDALEALPDRVEALEGLPGRVEVLEGLPERVEVLEGLPGRVEVLEGLPGRVEVLEGLVAGLEAAGAGLHARMDAVEALVEAVRGIDEIDIAEEITALLQAFEDLDPVLEHITAFFEVVDVSEDGDVIFHDTNVYVQSGDGETVSSDVDAEPNGKGNLIIGYDEGLEGDDKSGSHNLVVGPFHSYSRWGGVVFGRDNHSAGTGAVVVSGQGHVASGLLSTAIGGLNNESAGDWAVIAGSANGRANGRCQFKAGGLTAGGC